MILTYTNNNLKYSTIRQVLKQEFELSNILILKLKKSNNILINNESKYLDYELKLNDTVKVVINFEEDSSNIIPIKMDLNILYEDDYLLIIDKPAGIPVHPSINHYHDSLSNGVKFYFNEIGLNKKIRPVNRLDINTSGIVIFAKNEYIHEYLNNEMQNKLFKKSYIAICEGYFEKKTDIINLPIMRKEGSIIERCVNSMGAQAITKYTVLNEYKNMSKLLITLETGRTHQIRVHMSTIGHPIIGDDLYGTHSKLINRQALHAYKIKIIHPISKKVLEIEAPIPEDMLNINNLI